MTYLGNGYKLNAQGRLRRIDTRPQVSGRVYARENILCLLFRVCRMVLAARNEQSLYLQVYRSKSSTSVTIRGDRR